MEKQMYQDAENLVLIVSGGIGRNIMATAVVRNLKKAYPDKDIIVVAGCPDIFIKNPNIKRVIDIGRAMYFYEDYIIDKRTAVLNFEPYQDFDYLQRKKHFVECWCNQIGIKCDSVYPEMYFSEAEDKMAKIYVSGFNRKMILFQHSGGKIPENKSEKAQIQSRAGMYKRDIPKDVTEKIVEDLVKRGYMVGSVQHENQYLPPRAEKINFPIRAIIALVPHVEGIIGIDSFLMHGSACFKRKIVGVWGGTNPKVLGYPDNINLTREVCPNPMCHRPNSYLFDIEPTGYLWDCLYNDKCMEYSPEDIIKPLVKMIGGGNGKVRGTREQDPAKCGGESCGHKPNESNGNEKRERGVGDDVRKAVPTDSRAVGLDR